MNESDALDILDDLEGNEHAWVDFKEDYHIGGIGIKKAEFIRDTASMANTLTDYDDHYLFIGVDDDGDVVGVSSDSENYSGSGPRHIFSYDESDIQEIVDSNLEPSPRLMWSKFQHDSVNFGVLAIEPLSAPPAIVSQDINDNNGNRLLHRGIIIVRKGSGKTIAGREEVERIIKYRVEKQRDQILDGVNKAIQIGPEWVDRIGEALPDSPGIPFQTTEDPDEADVEVTQRITREPASTLDEQLNEDIAQWRGRGDDFIGKKALYNYYSKPSKLSMDNITVRFLTLGSIKNDLLGIFWLERVDREEQKQILLNTPDDYHRVTRAGKVLMLMGATDTFETLIDRSSTNAKYDDLRECKNRMGQEINTKINYLLNDGEYSLQHDSWSKSFEPKEMGLNDLRNTISETSSSLFDLQDFYERRAKWDKYHRFRDALWDLEVVLGAKQLCESSDD